MGRELRLVILGKRGCGPFGLPSLVSLTRLPGSACVGNHGRSADGASEGILTYWHNSPTCSSPRCSAQRPQPITARHPWRWLDCQGPEARRRCLP
jgi:hypothetical protein